MKIIKPNKLKSGDVVRIIAPSEPINANFMERFNEGVRVLEEDFGLRVKYSDTIFNSYYYSAGTRDERIKDFNDAWHDPETKMILMALGGSSANQLLDEIDYKYIKENPKIFSGISDGTTLLNAIFSKTGLVTYHGPDLLFTFGRKMSDQIKDHYKKAFFNGEVDKISKKIDFDKNEINKKWNTLRKGKASGSLLGGHSKILVELIATGYIGDFEDKILFIEGTNKDRLIDRQLTNLKLAGIFEKINGIILGWFEDFEEQGENRRAISDILLEVTKDYNFPILEISELGHNVENYVFPIGCKVTMDADKKIITYDEKIVI